MRNFGTSTRQVPATEEHCFYAFSVLDAHLHNREAPPPSFPDERTALFVTWNIRTTTYGDSDEHSRLRGCIGILEPRQLHVALKDYALLAALRDSRFPPVVANELPRLSCKVSLLSCFEDADDWSDWQVGTHGLVIEYTDPKLGCYRSATYLPQVMAEEGWTHRQTMESLIRKSGYTGRVDTELLESLKVTRYQSSITSMTWDEYEEAKAEAQARSEGLHAGVECAEPSDRPQLVRVAADGSC